MSVISGSSATPLAIESNLYHINKVLFMAGEYGGKAFGDFVINVILARLEDPTANISFDDGDVANVDLWFTTEKMAAKFIKHVRVKASYPKLNYSFTEVTPDTMVKRHGYSAQQYKLSSYGRNIAWVYIMINEEFPALDLDINCLTYLCRKDYTTGKKIVTKELNGERGFQKDELVNAIRNKEATMFED